MQLKNFYTLLILAGFSCFFLGCHPIAENTSNSEVRIAGAMKNVMWKGQLAGTIQLDSLVEMGSIYGIGPLAYLQGEILLWNGEAYVAKVATDSTMEVYEDRQASAPFFVYSKVQNWMSITLPESIQDLATLEAFILQKTTAFGQPFAFKLNGKIKSAQIHIQNLPPNTKVSSPKEAHQGQVNYNLGTEDVDLLGFFSKKHQGIFTHHDTFMHLHLITKDRQQMGHLDRIEFSGPDMHLFLPEEVVKQLD